MKSKAKGGKQKEKGQQPGSVGDKKAQPGAAAGANSARSQPPAPDPAAEALARGRRAKEEEERRRREEEYEAILQKRREELAATQARKTAPSVLRRRMASRLGRCTTHPDPRFLFSFPGCASR